MDDFNKSKNKHHSNGTLPYCKICCKTIFNTYLTQTKSVESTMWLTCAEVGVPFIRKVFEAIHNDLKNSERTPQQKAQFNWFGNYMSRLRALETKTDKWTDFSSTNVPMGDIMNLRKAEEAIANEIEAMELDWGKHEVEDYQFLEYRWETYTKGVSLTPAKETLYRKLCLVELGLRKEENEGADTKNKQAQLLTLMNKLGIDKFDVDDNTVERRMIESKIYDIENYEPAEYFDKPEMYADYSGYKKYWDNHLFRTIKNLITGSREYPKIKVEKTTNE